MDFPHGPFLEFPDGCAAVLRTKTRTQSFRGVGGEMSINNSASIYSRGHRTGSGNHFLK